jgi:hypothetical protein
MAGMVNNAIAMQNFQEWQDIAQVHKGHASKFTRIVLLPD